MVGLETTRALGAVPSHSGSPLPILPAHIPLRCLVPALLAHLLAHLLRPADRGGADPREEERERGGRVVLAQGET